MTDTPVTLLERLRHQPHESTHWERFVRLFTPILLRWVRRMGVHASNEDDVLQEVFAILIRKMSTFQYDPAKSFRAWLWTICRHECLAWLQQRNLTPQVVDVTTLPGPDDHDAGIEEEYRQQLLCRALELIRVDFPGPSWQIFWQTTVEGRSGIEVAHEFGVSANAVYLIRGRILNRLREELSGLDS